MKLWIFGDSHIGTMEFGVRHVPNWLGQEPPFAIGFYGGHGANWIDFETTEVDGGFRFFANRVPKVAGPVDFTIADRGDFYVFSSPLHSGHTYWDGVWHEFCPWECVAANPHLQGLSTSVVESWITAEMKCRFAMLTMLRDRGYRLAVLEPPKPLARTPRMGGTAPDVHRRRRPDTPQPRVARWLEPERDPRHHGPRPYPSRRLHDGRIFTRQSRRHASREFGVRQGNAGEDVLRLVGGRDVRPAIGRRGPVRCRQAQPRGACLARGEDIVERRGQAAAPVGVLVGRAGQIGLLHPRRRHPRAAPTSAAPAH